MPRAVKKKIEDGNYLSVVRNQYENFPYPPRKIEDEKNTFVYCQLSALDLINHSHYAGKRDFTKGFRALVAGGGTGDSTITLAEQIRDLPGEIIHLDISQASIEIAKQRAKARGLNNIEWVHGSLLDAPKLLKGKFDYINCAGVLHHLESPEAGLAALKSVLKDDGVMGLMVYAKYGREGVYQIQNLMKILNKNEPDMQNRVENCKTILRNLPTTSGFMPLAGMLTEISSYGDVGIYDLFLHSNDVAYSVPDLYRLLETSDIKLNKFISERDARGNNLYNLASYIGNDSQMLANLSIEEQQAAAELLHGKIIKHSFYAAKNTVQPASVDDQENVPFFSMILNADSYKNMPKVLNDFPLGGEVVCNAHGMEMRFIKTANAENIFKALDGKKTIREILKEAQASSTAAKKPTNKQLHEEFAAIYQAFNLHDLMLLRDKSVPCLRNIDEICANFGKKSQSQPELAL